MPGRSIRPGRRRSARRERGRAHRRRRRASEHMWQALEPDAMPHSAQVRRRHPRNRLDSARPAAPRRASTSPHWRRIPAAAPRAAPTPVRRRRRTSRPAMSRRAAARSASATGEEFAIAGLNETRPFFGLVDAAHSSLRSASFPTRPIMLTVVSGLPLMNTFRRARSSS